MHVMTVAKSLADTLEADPVAARQVKEYVSENQLIELLELSDAALAAYLRRDKSDKDLMDLLEL